LKVKNRVYHDCKEGIHLPLALANGLKYTQESGFSPNLQD